MDLDQQRASTAAFVFVEINDSTHTFHYIIIMLASTHAHVLRFAPQLHGDVIIVCVCFA